ncbi:prenyltransferase/squalene oxidase repeat-containing protein [Gimesia aquarii]|uniref:Prenyltransferase and squalene oxidase repeat protein n=1 Tax=Gimesia aquarii TaxID=2527964 RepID=A0A517WX33_9PLAN|nr:prenyltransferase/squalene oxidase repeat-containing protein [Gimesia aquarii]QDU09789.1 Prenyltransferase and squalene oxidase repeat protein [Gimesia aquarii]
MGRSLIVTLLFSLICNLSPSLLAGDKTVSPSAIKTAIQKSIPLIEKASAGSARERKCFTCHNQAMAVLVLAEAKKRGFTIDEANFQLQVDHTVAHLKRGLKNYHSGKGQGGGPDTASYALWALELSDYKPNTITSAVTSYLLERNKDKVHWIRNSTRPPSMSSDTNTNYFVIRALKTYGTEDQSPLIETRIKQAQQWLLKLKPDSTEERVFQLRSYLYLDVEESIVKTSIRELIQLQNEDGGWSQLPSMNSDAYATGTVLVALLRSGQVPTDDSVIIRGIAYLLDSQLPDGSWHIISRAKPFQTYFETGYPHNKDQFISVTAGSWATVALLLMLPETKS